MSNPATVYPPQRRFFCGALIAFAILCSSFVQAKDPETLTWNLWPGEAPGEIRKLAPEYDKTTPDGRLVDGRRVTRLTNVSIPTLTIYKPAPAIDTGTALVIAPGGGHSILAIDLEGSEVAEWLNSIGVTGIVLKYRVPGGERNPQKKWLSSVQDGQRAMSLVRGRAKEIGVDPNKIGIIGFSAGGSPVKYTALTKKRLYEPVDKYDEVSFRPDFAAPIYSGGLPEEGAEIGKDCPPLFMVIAHDDKRPVEMAEMYIALKKADVSAELHIYESGGHGYGLRRTDQPVTSWPDRMEDWMRWLKLLEPPSGASTSGEVLTLSEIGKPPDPPAGWTDGFVLANGIRIHYWRTGGEDKPVLLMAHGYSDDGLCWTNLAKELEEDYDIIMADARGHGLSDPPSPSDSADAQAEDLAGLIRELKLEKPILMGHSMGSSSVAWFAAKYPDIPGAVILEDPRLIPRPPSSSRASSNAEAQKKRREQILAKNNMSFEELVAGCMKSNPQWGLDECRVWAPSKRLFHPDTALRNLGDRPSMADLFTKITAPTLILKADAEGDVRKQNEEIASGLKRGRIVHIEGARHNVRRDQKARLLKALRAFLSEL